MTLDPQVLADEVVFAAGEKKAYDFKVLDISKISSIADYFIICTGRSTKHVQAIAEEIVDVIGEKHGVKPRKEGAREGRWVLLDYGDVVVHVFVEEERQFYNLERLWGDAAPVRLQAGM